MNNNVSPNGAPEDNGNTGEETEQFTKIQYVMSTQYEKPSFEVFPKHKIVKHN